MILKRWIVAPDQEGYAASEWRSGDDGRGQLVPQVTGRKVGGASLKDVHDQLLRMCLEDMGPRWLERVVVQHPDALSVWI
jgi:hypothetical protein